jgi:hypothetical protein
MYYHTPENPAEQLLIERGVYVNRSSSRRVLLGCVGCRWLRAQAEGGDVGLTAQEALKCLGTGQTSIYSTLNKLTTAGVMTCEDQPTEGRYTEHVYRPTETELGQAFLAKLSLPKVCWLYDL